MDGGRNEEVGIESVTSSPISTIIERPLSEPIMSKRDFTVMGTWTYYDFGMCEGFSGGACNPINPQRVSPAVFDCSKYMAAFINVETDFTFQIRWKWYYYDGTSLNNYWVYDNTSGWLSPGSWCCGSGVWLPGGYEPSQGVACACDVWIESSTGGTTFLFTQNFRYTSSYCYNVGNYYKNTGSEGLTLTASLDYLHWSNMPIKFSDEGGSLLPGGTGSMVKKRQMVPSVYYSVHGKIKDYYSGTVYDEKTVSAFTSPF